MDAILKTHSTPDEQPLGLLRLRPAVAMVSYRVADIERSLRFYVGVLGMTERARFPGFGPDERELVLEYGGARGAVLMLMWNVTRTLPYNPGDGYSRFTILVDDVHAAFRHMVDHGTPVVLPVAEANGSRFAVVRDPDGYMIELLQLIDS